MDVVVILHIDVDLSCRPPVDSLTLGHITEVPQIFISKLCILGGLACVILDAAKGSQNGCIKRMHLSKLRGSARVKQTGDRVTDIRPNVSQPIVNRGCHIGPGVLGGTDVNEVLSFN